MARQDVDMSRSRNHYESPGIMSTQSWDNIELHSMGHPSRIPPSAPLDHVDPMDPSVLNVPPVARGSSVASARSSRKLYARSNLNF